MELFRLRFWYALGASVLYALYSFFQWSLMDLLTPLILGPLWLIVLPTFLGSVVTSLTCLSKFRTAKYMVLIPLTINVVVFLIPYTRLWVTLDYYQHRRERDIIVAKVQQNILAPNVSYNASLIALKDAEPMVSYGGNEIVVEEHSGGKYIFFFTFRGILDHYSGFLRVPDGGEPGQFWDLGQTGVSEIVQFAPNWFWVSHH